MKRHALYIRYLVRHKFFVFRAGLWVGAPLWRLIIHDWSKLTPTEWFPYVERFFGNQGDQSQTEIDAYDRAWSHHVHKNPHHWNHWLVVPTTGNHVISPLKMPEKFVREMVADWMGANRVQTGGWNVHQWYNNNKYRIVLHNETRALVEEILNGKAKA
jgi:hypothetical protein